MHDSLFNYIKKFGSDPLTEEERALIRQAFAPLKLRKRQYFLQAGNECKHFAFITKGAMRQYTVDDKGAEHIVRLGIENWWMGDRESYISGRPSNYHIDACEDTEVLCISWPNMSELMKIPAYNEMLRQLDDNNNIANQRRITSTISSSAEQRYVDFSNAYPKLLIRFPQHVIASYLGITKDTLSRIRRHLMKK